MAPKIITIIGSLNTDLVSVTPRVPSAGETLTGTSFSTGPGGKGANHLHSSVSPTVSPKGQTITLLPEAVACARLSRPNPHTTHSSSSFPLSPSTITVKMLGAVGFDAFGPHLISNLQDSSIDTSGIQIVPNQSTGVAVILVEQSTGENRILLNPGANHFLQPSDFLTSSSLGDPLPSLIILQLEIPLPTVLQIIKTAKEVGVDVLLNPAPAVPLPKDAFNGLAHLIINESEAAILTGRKVEEVEKEDFKWEVVGEEFLGKGVRNVVVTLGAKGAFWANKEGRGYVAAEKVERVVDTTAAGDTFVGAYAVDVVIGNGDMGEVIKLACKAAGRTVEREGAQSAIPWADEVAQPREN